MLPDCKIRKTKLLKTKLKYLFLVFLLLGSIHTAFSQRDSIQNPTFEQQLKMIRLLTDTQQYSEAMRKLKEIENSEEITKTLENEVDYRTLVARVLRLSYQFDDAMHQLDMLPNLDNHRELKIKVDFRKAALFLENPKYTREERMKVVQPIITEGIKVSKEIDNLGSLASFYNLKASLHSDECAYVGQDCKKIKNAAARYYKDAMRIFLINEDTLNYHNSLNGLFRLSIAELSPELDSLKDLVLKYAESSSYFPNVTVSRNLLGHYFAYIKHDSLNYFKQTVLEKSAMIDAVNNNADNTIGKLKLLYEFDSLKADLNQNREVIAQKDLMIVEKNRRIMGNVFFSVVLVILSLILIVLFLKQRRLTRKMNVTNRALNQSNHNYQLLIKESNHRIKNNLQMILSIIELDKEGNNHKSQVLLGNISSKILTIAALHRVLNFEEHNQKVELKKYFNEIIEYFQDLSKEKVKFISDFTNLEIKSERIIYFGLVLNEMISNTLKHRCTKEDIFIQVQKTENSFEFTYKDCSEFPLNYDKHSGINLIEDLIVRFGGVDLKFNSRIGEYKFYFYE